MKLSPAEIAAVCHSANRGLQLLAGERVSPPWSKVPDWDRAGVIEGVELAQAGASARDLHASWCDFKRDQGWTYGPELAEAAMTHPNLVDYDDLPAEQRRKDDVFAAVVRALS